ADQTVGLFAVSILRNANGRVPKETRDSVFTTLVEFIRTNHADPSRARAVRAAHSAILNAIGRDGAGTPYAGTVPTMRGLALESTLTRFGLVIAALELAPERLEALDAITD